MLFRSFEISIIRYNDKQKKIGGFLLNDKELIGKVHSSMYQQLKKRGYTTAVDVLMDLEILSKINYLQLAFIIALNISLFKSAKSRLERDCSFESNESSLG